MLVRKVCKACRYAHLRCWCKRVAGGTADVDLVVKWPNRRGPDLTYTNKMRLRDPDEIAKTEYGQRDNYILSKTVEETRGESTQGTQPATSTLGCSNVVKGSDEMRWERVARIHVYNKKNAYTSTT